jgi:hypothetical protein
MSPSPLTRDGAAEEARRELSRGIYQQDHPGVLQQIWTAAVDRVAAVLRWIGLLLDGPAGWVIAAAVLAAAIALVVVVLRRRAREPGPAQVAVDGLEPPEPPLEPAPEVATAAELASLADRLAAEGRYAEAIRERLRAVVRSLADRGLIEERPARTAAEIAASARTTVPAADAALTALTTLFSDVWYGGRTAGVAQDAAARRLAEQVTVDVDRPAPAGAGA